MMSIFSVFKQKYPFLVKLKLFVKSEIWYQDWFEYAEPNGDVDVSNFDWKYTFWANLGQKIKTVSLSWNLVLGLVRICKI